MLITGKEGLLNLICFKYSETFDELPYEGQDVNYTVYYDGTDYGEDSQMEIVQGGENLKDE